MKPIRIGHIDLSFHAASAAVVCALLEQRGIATESVTAPHERLFQMLDAGEIDFLVAAWLPSSHGRYVDGLRAAVDKVTVLYEPYCVWMVPEYVPVASVSAVADLHQPEVLERMSRNIHGINPGAGISRFSVAMMEAYQLSVKGYRFHHGTEERFVNSVREGLANNQWFIVPLWYPQFLHAEVELRSIDEPKGLLGIQDEATLLMHSSVSDRISPDVRKELYELHIGNQGVSELDLQITVKGAPPLEAAQRWIEKQRASTR